MRSGWAAALITIKRKENPNVKRFRVEIKVINTSDRSDGMTINRTVSGDSMTPIFQPFYNLLNDMTDAGDLFEVESPDPQTPPDAKS